MQAVLGLLAVSLLGADGTPAPEPPSISYQVKFAEVEGLGWRSDHHAKLAPVSRQGSATVWTAPREVADAILARASNVKAAPRLTSFSEARATVFNTTTRKILTEAPAPTAGSVVRAAFAAPAPRFENAAEGFVVSAAGRKLDQGVLATVTMDETQITAVHTVTVPSGAGGGKGGWPRYDVPEFTGAKVVGEWLIPSDGVLLVSFGARTTAGPDGKAVVRERLAVLDAVPVAEDECVGPEDPADCPEIPMPSPTAPSRHLPQAFNAEGAPLPPLPDDPEPTSTLPGSSDPCATPQTKGARPARDADSHSERAAYRPDDAPDKPEPGRLVAAERDEPPPAPKTFSFRFPIRAGVTLEVHATARPAASADAPPPPLRPSGK